MGDVGGLFIVYLLQSPCVLTSERENSVLELIRNSQNVSESEGQLRTGQKMRVNGSC